MTQQLLTYGIIAHKQFARHFKVWSLYARFSEEEAQTLLKVLKDQAAAFDTWRQSMMLNTSNDEWGDAEAAYIERHMMDKQFESGAVYEILVFKEGPEL